MFFFDLLVSPCAPGKLFRYTGDSTDAAKPLDIVFKLLLCFWSAARIELAVASFLFALFLGAQKKTSQGLHPLTRPASDFG